MAGFADYLDALSPPRARAGFAALGAPSIGVPGIYDSEMWTMDVRWSPTRGSTVPGSPPRMAPSAIAKSTSGKAQWQSYVTCVRVAAVGGGWISQPWSVTGAALCTNALGQRQAPRCPWGVWRLPTCTSDSIALAWQGPRYLWAQQKMRELLAITPSRADAAQWVWSAYQLMSVLLWSTNVRLSNPQPRLFDYARQLATEGCLFGGALDLAIADWNSLSSVVDPLRGPGVLPPLVPLSRADFSPTWDSSAFHIASATDDPRALANAIPADAQLHPAVAAVVAQRAATAGSRTGWGLVLALRGADPEAPTPPFRTWMEATWGLETVPLPRQGRTRFDLAIPGAMRILANTRRALEHYVSVPFLKWQTVILNTYATEMATFVQRLPGADQYAFTASVANFAGHAQALQASSWNQGEVASYTIAAMSLITSLVSAPAAALLGIMFALLDMLVGFLGDQGLLASGFSVCPAFPFIRVPDPPCNALEGPVDAVGLPIDPPPGPIRLTPAQVATLRSLRTLTPSQQRLLTRQVVLIEPPRPPEAPKAGGGGVVLGFGVLALLALLVKRR